MDEDQAELGVIGVVIDDVNDKFQFYMEQMYTLGRHTKVQMVAWEAKSNAHKTYANACAYFKLIAKQDETHEQNNDGTTERNGFGAINSTMEIGTEIRGALETAFIDRGAAQAKERSEHLLQMRNSEARHEADMKKMATSLQAVTDALMAMNAKPRATPAPAMQPSQAPTTTALQTMVAQIAALTARM